MSIAMAPDVVEMALIPRPPKGREEAHGQILQMQGLVSSLCEAVHSYRQIFTDGRAFPEKYFDIIPK